MYDRSTFSSKREVRRLDVDEVIAAVNKWHYKLPFAAIDINDLIGVALEFMSTCSAENEIWRGLFWDRVRWRLMDYIRQDPYVGIRRKTRFVSLEAERARTPVTDNECLTEEIVYESGYDLAELDDIINRLKPRDARIVRRLLNGATLREIGDAEGVSESLICLERKKIGHYIRNMLDVVGDPSHNSNAF